MDTVLAGRIAAMLGALAVALGAFGAHGLKSTLARHGTEDHWQTAVFYHFIHAVVLLVLTRQSPLRRGPWWCFVAGIALFSGSLYLLALTNARWLGLITPLGGVSLLAGWLWLVCVLRPQQGARDRTAEGPAGLRSEAASSTTRSDAPQP